MSIAGHVTQLWQFGTAAQWIENVAIRPNGHLLLDSLFNGTIYTIDPNAKNPTPSVAVQIPDVSGVTGITPIGRDVYAVTAGVADATGLAFAPGTGKVVVIDFAGCDDRKPPAVKTAATFGNVSLPNGLASLPSSPHVVLSADSGFGNILRTDTKTGHIDTVYHNEQLEPTADAFIPLGINGLRIHGEYLYLTNTARLFLARIKIDRKGQVVGDLEILSTFQPTQAPDDIWVARDGTVYVTTHPNSVLKVTPNGKTAVLADANSTALLDNPTSAHLSADEKTLYVVTAGGTNGKGGQVAAIHL